MSALTILPRPEPMPRTLTVLFRRNPDNDRHTDAIPFEGYEMMWPDGQPLSLGFDAFCKHGQRLFGLGRQLRGDTAKLVDMLFFPVAEREAGMTNLPGLRVRRFCLERRGPQARVHFLDGTPTAM